MIAEIEEVAGVKRFCEKPPPASPPQAQSHLEKNTNKKTQETTMYTNAKTKNVTVAFPASRCFLWLFQCNAQMLTSVRGNSIL